MKEIKGRCACGSIEFSVHDSFLYAAYCHCSQCRRANGSSFTVFGGIVDSDFQVLKGSDSFKFSRKSEDAEGAFCGICCSPIYGRKPKLGLIHILYGTLDEAPSLLPQVHIYTGSKAPWDMICDDLPQYEEGLE